MAERVGYSTLLAFSTALGGARKIFVARDFTDRLPSALGAFDEPMWVLITPLATKKHLLMQVLWVGGAGGIRTHVPQGAS